MKFIVEEKDLYFLSLFFILKFNQTLVCIDDTGSNCIVVEVKFLIKKKRSKILIRTYRICYDLQCQSD